MNLFFTIFETVSFSLGILITTILLTVNRNGGFAKQCLALFMALHTLYAFILLIYYSRLLLHAPFILPIGSTFTLLTYPAAYIYIRVSLYEETRFRKFDWLLLTPTIIFLLFLIPYFNLSLEEQRALMSARYNNSGLAERQVEGLLPRYVFSFFRIGWSAFFIWKSFRLVSRFRNDYLRGSHRAAMMQWLRSFTRWLALILILALPIVILAFSMGLSLAYGDFAVAATMVYLMFQIFKRPGLLYNFQFSPNMQALVAKGRKEKTYRFQYEGGRAVSLPVANDEDDCAQLKNLRTIHSRLIENQAFLDPEYSMEQLIADVDLPRYLVSSIINREYGMGFRNLLNYHRVQYFINNYGRPEWSHLSIEGMGQECGFSNRSSFNRNFKLITGVTPSEYVKGKKKKWANSQPQMLQTERSTF